MKITYKENPLDTIIELDERETRELWFKIKTEEFINHLTEVHFYLGEGKYFNIDKARRAVNLDQFFDDDEAKSKIDQRTDELLSWYLGELKSPHGGDCTCFASTCIKCTAEDLLGVNTISGLGKHQAQKIESAFSYKEDGKWKQRPLAEALERLRTYAPVKSPEWEKHPELNWEAHLPRWKNEATQAHEWLLNYRNAHFGEQQ